MLRSGSLTLLWLVLLFAFITPIIHFLFKSGPGKPVNDAPLRKVKAHSGPVADLIFIEEGGAKLVTVGRTDGLVRIWKVCTLDVRGVSAINFPFTVKYLTEFVQVVYDVDEYEPSPDELEAVGGEEEEAAAPAEEEEEEEGQVKLPPIYDSGEEEVGFLDMWIQKCHYCHPFSHRICLTAKS